MQLDTEFLRSHYASLSDGELLSLDRADLVEAAQRIFDEEVERRQLSSRPASRRPSGPNASRPMRPPAEEVDLDQQPDDDSAPGWLEDAAEVYSRYEAVGTTPAPEAVHARDVLEAAEIPCHLELYEEPQEDSAEMRFRWRVLVPGKFTHRAASVLDRDIFNEEFEAGWRTHLEMLSDSDLRLMEPELAFCGRYDRIERVNRAYDEELERRRLKP